ncbi:MAG TPA: choice-of-anchor L domain-containing protein, partial [Microlunatus sp.]
MVQGFVTPPPRSRLRRKRLLAAVAATCSSALLLAAAAPAAHASPGQTITDLTSISATDLVTKIIGDGITVSNVQYTGNPLSAGTFAGLDPVGFDSGIVLSSGEASTVVGPNDSPGKTGTMETSGDSDLNAIVDPYGTEDASVLTFDFVPTTSQLVFDYVFSSEEYFEYVNTTFNDVFAFLVNGENCAITEDGAPVAINTINGGNPLGTGASRPTLYRNNVADDETGTAPLDLQADGLTVVMKCAATVNPNVSNRMKLAIADTTDASLDSAVFIRAGSLQANKAPSAADKSATTVEGTAVGVTLSGSDPDGDDLTFDVATQPGHGTLT